MNPARVKTTAVAILAFLAGVVGTRQWLHPPGKPEAEPAAAAEPDRAADGKDGAVAAAVQKNLGLEFAAVGEETVPSEIRAYGRVLDAAPLAGLVVEQASALAAREASAKELARDQALHDQGQIASDRVLEAAEAAARRDELLVESSRLRLAAAWGNAIATRTDLPALVRRLAAQEAALVRLDLPLGDSVGAAPGSARVAPLGDESRFLPVAVIGPAPVVDPQLQGRGFLGLLGGQSPPPGTVLAAWIPRPGPTAARAFVPGSALLRHDGGVFVEVRRDAGHFERRAVVLDRPWKDGWLVAEGLKTGESVVVAGAQQLLSIELKGAAAD